MIMSKRVYNVQYRFRNNNSAEYLRLLIRSLNNSYTYVVYVAEQSAYQQWQSAQLKGYTCTMDGPQYMSNPYVR